MDQARILREASHCRKAVWPMQRMRNGFGHMMTLTALALNPNLTLEQFKQLAQEHTEAKVRCLEQVAEALKGMTAECAVAYLQAILPILLSW